MNLVTLNQALRRVEIKGVEIESELVFAYFDKLPEIERDEQFKKAVHIGVLALEENRISSFLARTKNELGTELESLKIRFDLNAELFSKSASKGVIAEAEIAEYLKDLNAEHGYGDIVELTGSAAGALPRNKTGDILSYVDGDENKRVVIECKFAKNMKLGSIEKQDWYGNKVDTALGQLIEAQANRECAHAIIVFDRSSINPALLNLVSNITYRPPYGFVVVVDSRQGDYRNVGLAYLIARDLAGANRQVDFDADTLTMLLDRIIAEADNLAETRSLVEKNIANCNAIIAHVEKGKLSLESCRDHLRKFLNDGTLSKADLHHFYSGSDRRERYKEIQNSKEVTQGKENE